MSFARKLARKGAKRPQTELTPQQKKDRAISDLLLLAETSPALATLVRKAVRQGGLAGPMDVAIPVVHVERGQEWLDNLSVMHGSGVELSRWGYLNGQPFFWESLRDYAAPDLGAERKEWMRVRPDRQSLLVFFHADGEVESVCFDLAPLSEGAERAEEFVADSRVWDELDSRTSWPTNTTPSATTAATGTSSSRRTLASFRCWSWVSPIP